MSQVQSKFLFRKSQVVQGSCNPPDAMLCLLCLGKFVTSLKCPRIQSLQVWSGKFAKCLLRLKGLSLIVTAFSPSRRLRLHCWLQGLARPAVGLESCLRSVGVAPVAKMLLSRGGVLASM
ncbi:unnamed protein product [Amoebophrya sp. A25]|nr:unnamed protein product [Amoebophrya sp. A25]|eukprot:GSA25T00026173001.1